MELIWASVLEQKKFEYHQNPKLTEHLVSNKIALNIVKVPYEL